ncbi:prophage LambdaCh01 nuclease domain-containing protein [Neobacillus bataviensis LMG 21833]|uniref:Prophage LambdaCh01 nuclease domain-containing protein n=1 Tax=Neobacillus bataviensis LMG 21833 TaxID=1117379 RepID=K6DDK4_9BACI|nr:thermonuclease family protein [Neobacillus bataviensis]EKN70597.1 prophage LambdaCh01 nuclease domain-containing protein [Neobacillus bataviensis LMG 21833]
MKFAKVLLIAVGIISSMVLAAACLDPSVEKHTDQVKVVSENKDAKVKAKEEKEGVIEEKDKVEKENREKQVASKQSQEELAKSMGLELITVGRVVDGDTFVTSDGRKVRLVGVNTPESTTRHEEYGKEASNYTTSKLNGKQVWIQKDVSETDRYSRLLRIVWLSVPTNDMDENEIRTKMYNADLVLNGYAEPSTYPPDVKYSEYFVKFAREARTASKGLWAFGEQGTTKGDLDSGQKSSTGSSPSSGNTSGGTTPDSGSSNTSKESFKNCTEMRKVYPKGVPSTHPAYESRHDRDKDNWACEQ